MSRSLRVQLSLLLTDEVLYDGLIQPYRESKELTSLVIKLLEGYFYNPNVKNLIDVGCDFSEMLDSSLDNEFTSIQDTISKARETLAVMSFVSDNAKSILDDGCDDMLDRLNNVAKQTGGEGTCVTETGLSLPKFNFENQILDKPNEEVINSLNTSNESSRLNTLEEKLASHDNMLLDIKGLLENISSSLSQPTLSSPDTSKILTLSDNSQVPQVVEDNELKISEVNESIESEPDVTIANQEVVEVNKPTLVEDKVDKPIEDTPKVDSTESSDEELEDGTDIINAFFSNGAGFMHSF